MIPTIGRVDPLLSEEILRNRIQEMGRQITQDFEGKAPVVLGLLNGSFVFMADLMRAMDLELEVSFMRVASYGGQTVTTGEVKILHDLDCTIQGRHVLIVEDIVDTGLTLHKVRNVLLDRQPASIRIATLLDKPSRRRVEVPVDYVGFTIEDHFVVGMGLDVDGKYRNLPYVGIFSPEML
jgi:hypoxanthine phosphoribosyltransferase